MGMAMCGVMSMEMSVKVAKWSEFDGHICMVKLEQSCISLKSPQGK